MISACIADPFAVRLRIRGFDAGCIHRTLTGRKRQAAPSQPKIYREQMERVNQGLAGDIRTRALVAPDVRFRTATIELFAEKVECLMLAGWRRSGRGSEPVGHPANTGAWIPCWHLHTGLQTLLLEIEIFLVGYVATFSKLAGDEKIDKSVMISTMDR